MQEWRDIEGYEGFYQVSNDGQVRSLDRVIHHSDGKVTHHKMRVLSQTTTPKGYKRLKLSRQDNYKTTQVHRLVALAFIPNPHNYPMVNHKDENKANNHVSNLEWCDNTYNVTYGGGIQRGLETATLRGNKTRRRRVEAIHMETGERLEYASTRDAAKLGGFNSSQVIRCCNGFKGCVSHRGYKWRYLPEEA